MSGKFVQIAVVQNTDDTQDTIYALDEFGDVWCTTLGGHTDGPHEWSRVSRLRGTWNPEQRNYTK